MTNPIIATCPSCQKRLKAQSGVVGKQVRCPSCKNPFVVQAAPAKPNPGTPQSGAIQSRPSQPAQPQPSSPSAPPPQQPANLQWSAGTQAAWGKQTATSKGKAAGKRPSMNKGLLIGLSALGLVLLVGIGYFGLQFFAQGKNKDAAKYVASNVSKNVTETKKEKTPPKTEPIPKKSPNATGNSSQPLTPSGGFSPRSIAPNFKGPSSIDDVVFSQLPSYAMVEDQKEFQRTYEARVKTLERERAYLESRKMTGHIVIGHVELEDQTDPSLIQAQYTIAKDGTFLFVTPTLRRPIGFRMHQYEAVDVKLDNCSGKVVDVGTITLKKLPPSQLRSMRGKIALAGSDDASTAKVKFRVSLPPLNSIRSTNFGFRRTAIDYEIPSDGVLSASGFSPTKYYGTVDAPGYVGQYFYVDLSKGDGVDFGQITLEKTKTVRIEYVVAKPNEPFDFSSVQQGAATGGGYLRDSSSRKNIVKFGQNDGTLQFGPVWAKDRMLDLGVGELMAFRDVDRNPEKWGGVWREPVNVGHVYLYQQSKLHALFRIVSIE